MRIYTDASSFFFFVLSLFLVGAGMAASVEEATSDSKEEISVNDSAVISTEDSSPSTKLPAELPGGPPSKPPGPPSKPPSKPPTAPGPPSKPATTPPTAGPPAKAAPTPGGNPFGSGDGKVYDSKDDGNDGDNGNSNTNPFGTPSLSVESEATNPFSNSSVKDSGASNPFGDATAMTTKEAEVVEAEEEKEEKKEITPFTKSKTTVSSNSSKEDDAHSLVTVVRATQEVLVSDVERTLSVLQSLLRDATSNDSVHGRTLSKDMVHIFVRLMRAEFDSLLTWFVSQAENRCDGVGTNRHSCEVDSKSLLSSNEETKDTTMTTTEVALFDADTRIAFQSTPRFVLATSFLFRDFAARSIGYMLEVLASGGVEDDDDEDDDIDMMGRHTSDGKLSKMCEQCSSTLLAQYIAIKAQETVRTAVYNRLEYIGSGHGNGDGDGENQEAATMPTSIDSLAFDVLKNAMSVGIDASVLLGGLMPKYETKSGAVRNGPTPGNRQRTPGSGRGGQGGADIQLDIDRIFAKKVTIYGGTSFSREKLLQEYFRIVFKAMGEHTRSLTLTTFQYRACLVTARYLFDVLPTYCAETESLDYLLADWINSANERCLLPEGMSEAEIESVVTKNKLG
jgi:hypothetical protein